MRKQLLCLIILAALASCTGALAQDNDYENRTVFYDDDHLMSVASAGGLLYTLRDSGVYGEV